MSRYINNHRLIQDESLSKYASIFIPSNIHHNERKYLNDTNKIIEQTTKLLSAISDIISIYCVNHCVLCMRIVYYVNLTLKITKFTAKYNIAATLCSNCSLMVEKERDKYETLWYMFHNKLAMNISYAVPYIKIGDKTERNAYICEKCNRKCNKKNEYLFICFNTNDIDIKLLHCYTCDAEKFDKHLRFVTDVESINRSRIHELTHEIYRYDPSIYDYITENTLDEICQYILISMICICMFNSIKSSR